jgi:hypothetical protein
LPRRHSRASTRSNPFLKIEGVPGASKNPRAVHRAPSALQLPAPVVPQRSSVVDGTSNTVMIGEQPARPTPVAAVPVVRR